MSSERDVTAARAVTIARTWIGTPYHHQASLRAVGTDCLGLIRGVWRELYGVEPLELPNYSADWAEARGVEAMLLGAAARMKRVEAPAIKSGDVLVFRLRPGTVAKHAAIVTGDGTMIHAMEGSVVAEVALLAWWRRRIAGAFRFPHPTEI